MGTSACEKCDELYDTDDAHICQQVSLSRQARAKEGIPVYDFSGRRIQVVKMTIPPTPELYIPDPPGFSRRRFVCYESLGGYFYYKEEF